MSGLNLKISGEKKGKMKRVPTIEDLTPVLDRLGDDVCFLDGLLAAKSMEDQISTLKNMVTSSSNNIQIRSHQLKVLIKLLLYLKLKSPLRSAILRSLVNLDGELRQEVHDTLLSLIQEGAAGVDSDFVDLVATCLENSSVSHFSLVPCSILVLSCLESHLIKLYEQFRIESSPAHKLIVTEQIHQLVRTLIALLQKTHGEPSDALLSTSLTMLNDPALPTDTRTTSGILYVLSYKSSRSVLDYEELVERTPRYDEMSELCLCSGVLNIFTLEELLRRSRTQTVLETVLDVILSVENKNPADCSLVLGTSQRILLFTKVLLTGPEFLTEEILQKLLAHLWVHLDHFMDAVRHASTSSLTNVVSMGLKRDFVLDTIARELEYIPVERRAKHVALTALVGHMPVSKLLLSAPNLLPTLLDSAANETSANHIISSLEALMKQHYKEKTELSQWYDLWINPLLSLSETSASLEHILETAVKVHPGVINHVIEVHRAEKDKFVGLLLTCLRVGRKIGLLQGTDETGKWRGTVDYGELKAYLVHVRDDVRLSCFAMLSETKKTTELYCQEELNLARLFLSYNMNNQVPSVRQKFLASFKKFIVRFKESLLAAERQLLKKKQSELAQIDCVVQAYRDFVSWLIQFTLHNLFPGANPSRRCSALNVLTLISELGFWKETVLTELSAQILLKCLLDSYEENKILSRNLLRLIPVQLMKFDNPTYLKSYLKAATRLASSIRPQDSLSAAYFVSLLTHFPLVGDTLCHEFSFHHIQVQSFLTAYCCLAVILERLKTELSTAEKSLLLASSTAPMYGQILVIRHLVREVDFEGLSSDENWRKLIADVINTAFDCDRVVAPVVNNSSPEGHLPMDFDYDLTQLKSDGPKVTAQMVLICSWRTVKEVTLLLGELSEKLPISTDSNSGLISEKEIVNIGAHLMSLMCEVKHRGAFEQAYLGFCQLASRSWRYPTGTLHELPRKWLDETIDEVVHNKGLSATRRSAGIPFVIQGLVVTEPEVDGGLCFHRGMKILLDLAETAETVESRTHAMNILRALYRHSALGEKVSPYVAKGMALAIQGFNSTSWAERNSSTLLLSSLMTRVFGVPRSRSEKLSWKNKMTGRIFFQRYPILFEVLLNHLKTASTQSMYPAIYPALLILGRLYPSSLEGTDSNLQLTEFIPHVSECSGSCVFKTRSLAASAMVALITPNIFMRHVDSLFGKMMSCREENLLHGLLLQALKLFRLYEFGPDLIETLRNRVPAWASTLTTLNSRRHSYTVKTAVMKIFLQFLLRFNIKSGVVEPCRRFDSVPEPGQSIYFVHVALFLLFSNARFATLTVDLVQSLLKHSEYEVVLVTCDFIDSLLTQTEFKSAESDVDPFSVDSEEIVEQLRTSQETAVIVLELFRKSNHCEDTIRLLKLIRALPLVFPLIESEEPVVEYFSRFCRAEDERISSLAFQCIASFVNLNRDFEPSNELFQLINRFSMPESEDSCRACVAHLIAANFHQFTAGAEGGLITWTALVRLINDDSRDIRNTICTSFNSESLPDKTLVLMLEQFSDSKYDMEFKAAAFLTWSIGRRDSYELEITDEERVFDKGDFNSYSEDLTLNRLTTRHLRDILSAQPALVTKTLNPFIVDFVKCECSLSGTTLQDIIADYQAEVKNFDLSEEPFRVDEIKISVEELKLKNIIEVLVSVET